MRRFVQVFAWALSAVIVGGVIASATPGHRNGPKDDPTPIVSPSPEAIETEAPDATETEAPETESDGTGGVDFSACEGKTGLDNAICRHVALLEVMPDNQGLVNSLARLQQDQANQQARDSAAGSHGHSGESHGHSGESHGHSGESHGNGNGH